jgi:hypothetical protein
VGVRGRATVKGALARSGSSSADRTRSSRARSSSPSRSTCSASSPWAADLPLHQAFCEAGPSLCRDASSLRRQTPRGKHGARKEPLPRHDIDPGRRAWIYPQARQQLRRPRGLASFLLRL